MIGWIKSLFCKEEEIVGQPKDAWRAYLRHVTGVSRSISKGKSLEDELIREIDKLSDNLNNVRSLLCRIKLQKDRDVDNRENNESRGNTSGLS